MENIKQNDLPTTKELLANASVRNKISAVRLLRQLLKLNLSKEQFYKLEQQNALHFSKERHIYMYGLMVYVLCILLSFIFHAPDLVWSFIRMGIIPALIAVLLLIANVIREGKVSRAQNRYKYVKRLIAVPPPAWR